jgi:hypothetical protein
MIFYRDGVKGRRKISSRCCRREDLKMPEFVTHEISGRQLQPASAASRDLVIAAR